MVLAEATGSDAQVARLEGVTRDPGDTLPEIITEKSNWSDRQRIRVQGIRCAWTSTGDRQRIREIDHTIQRQSRQGASGERQAKDKRNAHMLDTQSIDK